MRKGVVVKSVRIGLLFLFAGILLIPSQTAWAEEGEWLEQYTTFWDGKAKLGGEIRLRGEAFNDFDRIYNDDVNKPDRNDDFLLSRARLSLDLRPAEVLRLYLQLQDSHQYETDVATAFRRGPTAREDRLDIYQAFVDITPLPDFPFTLRVGRQELNYGRQRLIGGFGWSNVGRTFDAVKGMFDTEPFFVDVFFANVVVPEDDHLNEEQDKDDFFGVYGGWKKFPKGVLEGYFLVHDNDVSGFETYTFGTRLEGKLTKSEVVDYSAEFAIQTGHAPLGKDQQAFATHVGGGYTFLSCPATPRVGIEYNFSTGDENPDDDKNETFDNLFPTNHPHYGYMDLFSWRNMHNIKLSADAKPLEKLKLQCDLHFFWLDETAGGWFNAGGATIRPGTPNNVDNFVGEELDLTAIYRLNKHVVFMAGYSHFFSGEFVRETGPGDDADWGYVQTTLSF